MCVVAVCLGTIRNHRRLFPTQLAADYVGCLVVGSLTSQVTLVKRTKDKNPRCTWKLLTPGCFGRMVSMSFLTAEAVHSAASFVHCTPGATNLKTLGAERRTGKESARKKVRTVFGACRSLDCRGNIMVISVCHSQPSGAAAIAKLELQRLSCTCNHTRTLRAVIA